MQSLKLVWLAAVLVSGLSWAQAPPAQPPLPPAPPAQAPFCASLQALTTEPAVAAAHWGLSVTAPDGTTLCSLNDAQLFRPASANKVFTSAAALALLGPDHRFTTTVIAEGEITRHTLQGDLVLVGSGDPTFGGPKLRQPDTDKTIADLEDLAAQVAATGLTLVRGSVLGDDRLYTRPLYPAEWSASDLVYGFAAPVSALTVHDNSVVARVAFSNPQSGKPVVTVTPGVTYYTVDNQLTAAEHGPPACDQRVSFDRPVGSRTVTVSGSLAHDTKAPCAQALAIADPAEYAALALRDALLRHGVQVTGPARTRSAGQPPGAASPSVGHDHLQDYLLDRLFKEPGPKATSCAVQRVQNPGDPPDPVLTTLATHTSEPLAEDLAHTVKASQNLHAELYLRGIGAALGCEHTLPEALYTLRRYLLFAGVAPDDFHLEDGSGLSTHDLVTPRAFTRLLTFAAAQPWFAQWRAMLPVGGVDGTLAARFPGTLKGKVFAKTGTLGESRVLAGYVTAASGNTVSFSIMVDNHLPGTTADRSVMDRMVETIAAAN